MKNFLLAALFLVTWNEFELQEHWETPKEYSKNGAFIVRLAPDWYFVKTTTQTIKLETQKDVDLFLGPMVLKDWWSPPLGMSNPPSYTQDQYTRKGGLIGDKAFNIEVEEIK